MMADVTRKTLSSTSSRQSNCARGSHSKSRNLHACQWRQDRTSSSILPPLLLHTVSGACYFDIYISLAYNPYLRLCVTNLFVFLDR